MVATFGTSIKALGLCSLLQLWIESFFFAVSGSFWPPQAFTYPRHILAVYALFPRNKPIQYFTSILYAAEVIAYTIGLALAVPLLEYDQFCVITKAPLIFALAASVSLALL